MPPKFFITHSWKDIEFARKLTDDLHQYGLDGFFDAYSMKPGDSIASRIEQGLNECEVYVPILSSASLESQWCRDEIDAAIFLANEPGRNGRPHIVPILVEDCSTKMPLFLRKRLYIRFDRRYADAFNELLTKGFGISLPTVSPKPPPEIISPPPKIITPPPPKVEIPALSFVNPKDGKEMILIPAGEFVMGSNDYGDEKPPHRVYLDAFYVSRYPVTNAEYKKFVDATKHETRRHWNDRKIPQGKENHPVVNVTWNDAVEYCKWAGVYLPTEAEWEKAASWDDVIKEKRVYPWGKDFDASKCNTNESSIGGTTPVGKYSPQGDSPYGIADMAGNVWEWCADWYNENYYQNSSPKNPTGADSGQARILRGGSWNSDATYARCANRGWFFPSGKFVGRGFRCAKRLSS